LFVDIEPFFSPIFSPLALPFVLVLLLLVTLLITMIEIGILGYAHEKMGINRRYIFTLLLSLLGSYVNIPVAELPAELKPLMGSSWQEFWRSFWPDDHGTTDQRCTRQRSIVSVWNQSEGVAL
jgi:hypothetical protein